MYYLYINRYVLSEVEGDRIFYNIFKMIILRVILFGILKIIIIFGYIFNDLLVLIWICKE